MIDYRAFQALSPTTLADVLPRKQVMDAFIRPLWSGMPRIAGPAYPVQCAPGDNLMLHAAIYRAPRGSVIAVETGDMNFALAGGNVCAVAQKNGIAGFVLDGAIRDLAEIRSIGFPMFARGVIPVAGRKDVIGRLNVPVRCGGVLVSPHDIIVADEEGIVVVPCATQHAVLDSAQALAANDAAQTLEAWEISHRKHIDELLCSKGFAG